MSDTHVNSNKTAQILCFIWSAALLISLCGLYLSRSEKIDSLLVWAIWLLLWLISLYLFYLTLNSRAWSEFPSKTTVVPIQMRQLHGRKAYVARLIFASCAAFILLVPVAWYQNIELGGNIVDLVKESDRAAQDKLMDICRRKRVVDPTWSSEECFNLID